MRLLANLYTLLYFIDSILSQCILPVKRQSFNQIMVYRKFANGSIAILDDFGKYGVYSSTGVQQYYEQLTLPMDAVINDRMKIGAATISSAGQLSFILTDGNSYNYANGAVTGSQVYGYTSRAQTVTNVKGIPDLYVTVFSNLLQPYSVSASGFLVTQSSIVQSNPYNTSYIHRTSANNMIPEIQLISLANIVITLKVTVSTGVY
jgi:hypothetical protein